MYEVLLVLYLLVAIALIALIMVQKGKGAEMGASFGSGASNTVFGASGSGNFLTRMTAVIAVTFFLLSLMLGNMVASDRAPADDFSDLTQPATEQQPRNNDLPPGN
ncbi:preprotein translocase subunit SecG [Aliidiomarina halalkaliphila]|uniref:Protein-export membrane protein SecG n=1 Tax=Aliidiomarina halalkaliphila TaxID=2593535 RepID=A0A552X341_9GAMM|nr:preprotein translocase subunit SecG [Aliidiomarina halalkaliphila]TRW49395.1 preprotein translocase subunit SecG [Aliidiomarina halalkaliphila]